MTFATGSNELLLRVKDTLRYNFQSMCIGDKYRDVENIEEQLSILLSPLYIREKPLNNPFIKTDYIDSLASPHLYKMRNLEFVKNVFDTDKNLLLKIFQDSGLIGLKKKVLTYCSTYIIELFLLCLYIAYLSVEYILIFSQELHDIAYFIHTSIEQNEVTTKASYIPYSIHEQWRLYKIENTDSSFSKEEANITNMQSNKRLEDIDESYKRRWNQLQKAYIKIFKVGLSKIVSKSKAGFFRKYYGRIPHLFKQYGSDAQVVENKMANDPGEILSTSCVKYVERMSSDATALFDELLQLARKLTSTVNIDAKISILKSYCKKFPIEDAEPAIVENNIMNETIFRIASSILQKNEIYGFTVDGIVQNRKFPPANHIVTSLFVRNPHEKPFSQSVSNIFTDEKHILMFAHPETIVKFNNLYKASASKIIDTFNPKMASISCIQTELFVQSVFP
jgi:hypothetical protein